MAEEDDNELIMVAIQHYQTALGLFIEHLGSPEKQGWITFPALWLFIHYEQQYGDDPSVLQKHLQGLRDVIAFHGAAILPYAIGGQDPLDHCDDTDVAWHMIDRTALWTIDHDACAAFFGFGGSLVRLVIEQYPGSLSRLIKSSRNALSQAFGPDYPAEGQLWDTQHSQIEMFQYSLITLRFGISNLDGSSEASDLLDFARKLKQVEEEFSSLLCVALSPQASDGGISSNMCIPTAQFYAIVALYERQMYRTQPVAAIAKVLYACAKLAEVAPSNYLWRVAWPMFVAALETDDLIHQQWVLGRFKEMQVCGENLRRARIFLEVALKEQRRTGQRVPYLSWLKEGPFEKFVL
ncbi:hypothetical protein A1O3_08254 [Capronia epimyces CBS 606.96]|uniref:Uncharacterized protein n=1 Tax=Capronia epimyces CBS 606.96 TaxID=1182542 RepID=W9XID9_9EURO|nr:uncharacterized protein A1O3_08254 [Capronia epimyces CBS 606.96]EXJ79968.1 hypothetical protein A1O3_08254 [Capronia epimyces CBS 606.96]